MFCEGVCERLDNPRHYAEAMGQFNHFDVDCRVLDDKVDVQQLSCGPSVSLSLLLGARSNMTQHGVSKFMSKCGAVLRRAKIWCESDQAVTVVKEAPEPVRKRRSTDLDTRARSQFIKARVECR